MPKSNTKYTSQHIDNQSFNDTYQVAQSLPLEYDPSGGVKMKTTEDLSLRWEVSGSYVYLGEAAPSSAEGSAVWRIQRITTSTGKIEYADGNSEFDNVWSNRASLSYS